jgi:predicted transcriptional regulator
MTDDAHIERATDSTVLRLLLDAREPWCMDELVGELQDLSARDAVGRLTQTGLVHRHGEFVFPTRAARRAAELEIAD